MTSNEFFDKTFKNTYLNLKYCKTEQNRIVATEEFQGLLSDHKYRQQLFDILEVSESEYRTHYRTNRRENDLALYEKYTRQDVCRLLNWRLDEHGTVNGYKVDPITKSLFWDVPLFRYRPRLSSTMIECTSPVRWRCLTGTIVPL